MSAALYSLREPSRTASLAVRALFGCSAAIFSGAAVASTMIRAWDYAIPLIAVALGALACSVYVQGDDGEGRLP